jgi:Amt family ammonium transporter
MSGTNLNTYPTANPNEFNSGDTAWMLAATALVLLMTMPGLAIYYSGMVKDKNVLACKFLP